MGDDEEKDGQEGTEEDHHETNFCCTKPDLQLAPET
jgi:hypothetical protein